MWILTLCVDGTDRGIIENENHFQNVNLPPIAKMHCKSRVNWLMYILPTKP